jgi:hypothetical protein
VNGIELIAAERRRQITEEGYIPDVDLRFAEDELVKAAICYAFPPGSGENYDPEPPPMWPWSATVWKPCPNDRVQELVKAGALVAAEIDRLLAGDRSG